MNFNPNDNEIDENSEHASFIKVLMAMSEEDRNRIAQILRAPVQQKRQLHATVPGTDLPDLPGSPAARQWPLPG